MTAPEKMKVAVITANPTPYRVPFFRLMAEAPDVDLTVFFMTRGSATRPWEVQLGGFKHEFLKEKSLPMGGKDSARYRINPSVISRLRRGRFDAVVIAGYNHFTTQAAIVYCTLTRTPWCLMSESHVLKRRGRLKTLLKNLLLKPFLSRMGAAMVTGTLASCYIQAFGVPAEAVFIVANTPDVKALMRKSADLRPQRGSIRKNLSVAGRKVLLFVGRLLEEKGLATLFEAYAVAKAKREDLALLVVGDGRARSRYEKLVADRSLDNVRFLGFRSQEELPEIYAAGDIFVLPSLVEPWGVVVNEAMASSLPVILSDQVGASGDLVENGANGFAVPAGDPDALRERILEMCADDATLAAMGRRSREIISGWTYEQSVINFYAAVKTAITRTGRRR